MNKFKCVVDYYKTDVGEIVNLNIKSSTVVIPYSDYIWIKTDHEVNPDIVYLEKGDVKIGITKSELGRFFQEVQND